MDIKDMKNVIGVFAMAFVFTAIVWSCSTGRSAMKPITNTVIVPIKHVKDSPATPLIIQNNNPIYSRRDSIRAIIRTLEAKINMGYENSDSILTLQDLILHNQKLSLTNESTILDLLNNKERAIQQLQNTNQTLQKKVQKTETERENTQALNVFKQVIQILLTILGLVFVIAIVLICILKKQLKRRDRMILG